MEGAFRLEPELETQTETMDGDRNSFGAAAAPSS